MPELVELLCVPATRTPRFAICARVTPQTGIPFGYNDTAENYPKFGIYRGVGAGVNVAEFANVELGTTDLTSRITAPLPIEF